MKAYERTHEVVSGDENMRRALMAVEELEGLILEAGISHAVLEPIRAGIRECRAYLSAPDLETKGVHKRRAMAIVNKVEELLGEDAAS